MSNPSELTRVRQAYIEAFFAFDDALNAANSDGSPANVQCVEDAIAMLRTIHREYFACKKRLSETESLLTSLSARPVSQPRHRSKFARD